MNDPLVSILICTLPKRKKMFDNLIRMLQFQDQSDPLATMEILWDDSEVDSIGEKRNRLLMKATAPYLAFIDDDDAIPQNYFRLLAEAVRSWCDCASLKGEITIDGGPPEIFEHSLKYSEWKTTNNEVKYERYPNHLNMIRSSIAKQFKFPETNHGEDHNWSKQLHESGLLKTEYYIPEIIYYYNYISKK